MGVGAPPAATFVLRKKPPGRILASAHAVEREYAVQSALGAAGALPVPRMVSLCEDASVLGTPFYLMSHAAGHVFVQPGLEDLPTPAHRAAVYAEMAATLGALHRVDPAAVGLSRFGRPDEYSRRQLECWARQYRDCVSVPEPRRGPHRLAPRQRPSLRTQRRARPRRFPTRQSRVRVPARTPRRARRLGGSSPSSTGNSPRWARLTRTSRTTACRTTSRRWIPTDPRADARRRTRRSPRVVFPRGFPRSGNTCAPGRRRPDYPTRRRRVRMESSVGRFTSRYRCFEERPSWRGCARARRRGTRPRPTRRRREHWWRRWRIERSSSRGLCPGACPGDRVGGDGAENAAPRDDARGRVRTESAGGGASGHAASVHVRARLPRRGGARGARGVAGSLVCVRGG